MLVFQSYPFFMKIRPKEALQFPRHEYQILRQIKVQLLVETINLNKF